MESLTLSLVLLELTLTGSVLSEVVLSQRKTERCRNPSGKLGQTLMKGCAAKAVCAKAKRGAQWETCKPLATGEELETRFDASDSKFDMVNKKLDRIMYLLDPQPTPISSWNFEESLKDSIGGLHGSFVGVGRLVDGALVLNGTGYVKTYPIKGSLIVKTFEVWVLLSDLQPTAGGIISLTSGKGGGLFDAIVWSEGSAHSGMWLAGSNYFTRTKVFGGLKETESIVTGAKSPVHLVMVYHNDGTIACYRNGLLYGTPYSTAGLPTFRDPDVILFGLRHLPSHGYSNARIYHANLYNFALEPDQVLKLYKKGYKIK